MHTEIDIDIMQPQILKTHNATYHQLRMKAKKTQTNKQTN
jgi:hypothetical protein